MSIPSSFYLVKVFPGPPLYPTFYTDLFFVPLHVCVCMWRSEGNLQESILSLHRVGPGD